MNTAARSIGMQFYRWRHVTLLALRRKTYLYATLLSIAIVASAFSVVYTKDLYRRTFMQEQTLLQQQQTSEAQWSKLLLEESTWASQTRIQQIASRKLDMVMPNPKDIILLKRTETA